MAGTIHVERNGGVATLTFDNQSRRNAMSLNMLIEARTAFEDFRNDPDLRVVVITGAGDAAFNAGADLAEFEEKLNTPEGQLLHRAAMDGMADALSAIPVPVIARIRGSCIGGGLAVALLCDLRIAARTSQFATPAAKLGIGYGYTQIKKMCAIVGTSNAREILFTGRKFGSEEAVRIGLIHRLFEDADFDNGFAGYVREVAANAPLVTRATKTIIRELENDPDARDLPACTAAIRACFESDDFREGRRAFLEKRPPAFTGR